MIRHGETAGNSDGIIQVLLNFPHEYELIFDLIGLGWVGLS